MDNAELAKKCIQYQKQFVASAFSQPDIAYGEYAYISSDIFTDKTSRDFWEEFLKNGGDAQSAADRVNIFGNLTSYINNTPDIDRIDIYAENLVKYSQLVELGRKATDILRLVSEEDADGALEKAGAMIDGHSSSRSNAKEISEVADKFNETIEAKWDGLKTGIVALDKAIGCLVRQDCSVWASRTSVGKTTVIWQISRYCAESKKRVLYVSTESSAADLWARSACGLAGVSWVDVISNRATIEQKEEIKTMSKKLSSMYDGFLYIDDDSDTLAEIHKSIAHVRPDLIVLDHLDELSIPAAYAKSKIVWLGEALKYMRRLAKKYDAHVAVVHQLNRGVEDRENHRPVLSDLRGSGDLEQKADEVFMLYREDVYSETPIMSDVVPMEIWVRKTRMTKRDVAVNVDYDLKRQEIMAKRLF